jgi:hypothetical protein
MKRETTSHKLNNSLLFFQICFSIFLFLFSYREGGRGQCEIMQEDVGCTGVTTPALYTHGVTTVEVKQLDSAGMVKRYSKSDLTYHLTSRMTRPLHHEICQPYLKRVP